MFYRIAHATIKYMTLVITAFLCVISLISTQRYGVATFGEIVNGCPIYNVPDSLFLNLLGIIAVVFLTMLCRKLRIQPSNRFTLIFQGIIILLGFIFCLSLFRDTTRIPTGDQMQVYSAALYFNQGDYINLSKGGYISMYPQQLGYIAFMQLIFRITGVNTYQLMQLINCFFIAGILLGLFLFLNDLIKDNLFRILGSIVIVLSFPLYLLHSWVYGDIAFLFFVFMFLHSFCNYLNKPCVKKMMIPTIWGILMLVFRKNALILLLAAFFVFLFHGIFKKNKRAISFGIALIAIPLILWNSISFHYQQKASVDTLQGLPASCWIAMGMIEDASKPGWFNNYGVSTYYNNHCDYDVTNAEAVDKIAERIRYFFDYPADAASFWKRKICTQWNDPFFGTAELIAPKDAALGSLSAILYNGQSHLMQLLSFVQSFVYLGFLFYLLLQKHDTLLTRLPEVIFLGGFLFSLLWEANSRYVYPYFLIIIPASILGWKLCVEYLKNLRKDYEHEKNKH